MKRNQMEACEIEVHDIHLKTAGCCGLSNSPYFGSFGRDSREARTLVGRGCKRKTRRSCCPPDKYINTPISMCVSAHLKY